MMQISEIAYNVSTLTEVILPLFFCLLYTFACIHLLILKKILSTFTRDSLSKSVILMNIYDIMRYQEYLVRAYTNNSGYFSHFLGINQFGCFDFKTSWIKVSIYSTFKVSYFRRALKKCKLILPVCYDLLYPLCDCLFVCL